MSLDLTKKVELYYGRAPLKGANDKVKEWLDQEREFCAVYVHNDVPSDVHYKTSAELARKFGAESGFAQRKGSCVRPYYVAVRDGEEVVVMKSGPMKVEKPERPMPGGVSLLDAREVYELTVQRVVMVDELAKDFDRIAKEMATFRAGGLFFNEDIAETVIGALQKKGYDVVKRYE